MARKVVYSEFIDYANLLEEHTWRLIDKILAIVRLLRLSLQAVSGNRVRWKALTDALYS